MAFPIIAVLVAVLFVVAVVHLARVLRAERPPTGTEPVPATGLQRAALWGALAVLAVVGVAAWLLISHGPETVMADDELRLQFTSIVLAGLALFALLAVLVPRTLMRRKSLDERDLAVLSRAPMFQGVLMLLTVAAWTIGLQETFRGTAGVPTAYLHLIFWSCLAANMLAWPLGILAGYRRG